MEIIRENENLLLTRRDGIKVNINFGDFIKYKGHYYNDIVDCNIQYKVVDFIGIVQDYRYNCNDGYTGFYVEPLYVWNEECDEWYKIINCRRPSQKYFFYPALLMLPKFYYNFHPLYYLDSCENVDINSYLHIVKKMDIRYPYNTNVSE